MFWKWEKVNETLYFKVHAALVPPKLQNDFDIAWHRGNNASLTDKLRPDKKGRLKYEENFSVPVTMFINKKDKSVRPKIVEFLLRRHTEDKEVKFYGRISINVAEFYKNEKPNLVTKEMESGRSIPPVIHISFSYQPIPKDYNPTYSMKPLAVEPEVHEEENPNPKVKLEDWDKSDAKKEEEDKKEEKPEGEEKKEDAPQEIEKADVEEVLEPRKRGSFVRYSRATSQILSSDKIPKDDTAKEEDKPMDLTQTEGKEPSMMPKPIDENTPLQPISEDVELKKKKDEEESSYYYSSYEESEYEEPPPEVDEDKINKFALLIQKVLLRPWPAYQHTATIDENDEIACPPAALPFCATMMHCQVLVHEQCLNAFVNFIVPAPLQNNCWTIHRLYTYAIVILYARKRKLPLVDQFLSKMVPILFSSMNGMLKFYLDDFMIIVNRLASTRFQMNQLVDDFVKVFNGTEKKIKQQFPLVGNYMLRYFVKMVDYKFAQKIAETPLRFNSKAGSLWSGFFTMAETAMLKEEPEKKEDEEEDGLIDKDKKDYSFKVTFDVAKQVCHLLTLSSQVAENPDFKDKICPNIPDETVAYILENIKPDEMMPLPVTSDSFVQARGLSKNTPPKPLGDPKPIDLDELADLIDYEAWRRCIEEESVIEEYKYFVEYFKADK